MKSSKDAVEAAVLDYMARFGVHKLTPIISQPPHYVFNAEDTYVVRVIIATDAEDERKKVAQCVALLRELRRHGAQVMEFFNEPVVRQGAVIVISPFYPYELPNSTNGYAIFGQALATLHNAGWQIPDDVSYLQPINPLRVIWELLYYLREREGAGVPFSIGSVQFPAGSLQLFENQLTKAQAAYSEMMEKATSRQRMTTLLLDVYPGNVYLNNAYQPRLIDLLDNLAIGPLEYDLARPNAHWVRRIGRDPQLLNAFMEGYKTTLDQKYDIDGDILRLAITVADIYYAVSMLKNAVKAHRLGDPSKNEWQITEVVSRLHHLDNPTHRWKAARDYQ